jgi:hypothetical protein
VSCSPACGTLQASAVPSFAATYIPPASVPSSPNDSPTITASSIADPSKKDSFSFSLSFGAGALSGDYVYLLRGFGPNGESTAIAGTVALDTKGNVLGGRLDVNIAGQVTTAPAPLLGTFQVDTSFNGVSRATINITNFTFPGTTSSFSMKCVLSADGKRGKAIEYDGSGFLTAGTFLQQDAAAITGAIPVGSFAFGVDSDSPAGTRVVAAGEFSLGPGGISGGIMDQSQARNVVPIYSGVAIASGPATAPDSSGRGTLTLNARGNSALYAYYVVNAAQLKLIEIDDGKTFGTVLAGTARLQNSLSASSVIATSVFQMTGVDQAGPSQAYGPAVLIGVMSVSPGSLLKVTFDSNDVGTVMTTRTASGQIVSFDPPSGRGVLSLANPQNGGFPTTAVFYLYDAGAGFLIDADATSPPGTPADQQLVNRAYSGTLIAQRGQPLGSQSISGNLISISGASAIPSIPDIAVAADFNSSTGLFSAIADVASLPSQIGKSSNRTFTEGYSLTDPTLGHGSLTLPPGFFNQFSLNQPAPATFYLAGPNLFVLIGTLSGADSGISIFEPE